MKQDVVSREYKIMLKKERFVGSQDDLIERAKDFWNAFKDSIQDIVFDTDGNLKKIEKQRTLRFYDSADRRLRENDYVFRERVDLNTEQREVTLKFRHPDRYISQARDMAAGVKNGRTKFEEDIKFPFISNYLPPKKIKKTLDRFLGEKNSIFCPADKSSRQPPCVQ